VQTVLTNASGPNRMLTLEYAFSHSRCPQQHATEITEPDKRDAALDTLCQEVPRGVQQGRDQHTAKPK
jgi:hypothetical protein